MTKLFTILYPLIKQIKNCMDNIDTTTSEVIYSVFGDHPYIPTPKNNNNSDEDESEDSSEDDEESHICHQCGELEHGWIPYGKWGEFMKTLCCGTKVDEVRVEARFGNN